MKKYILIFTIMLLTALSFGCASNKIESQNVSTPAITSTNTDPLTILDSNLSKDKDGEYIFTMTVQANKDINNPNIFYAFHNKTGDNVESGIIVTPNLTSGEKYVYTSPIYSDDEITGYNLTQNE
jgi:hypothetical protein